MFWAKRLVALSVLQQVSSWTFGTSSRPARIAVIGGGIGGTASAYFLQQHFGDNAILDLYESSQIGGRLALLTIAGNNYEVGGTIIHPDNRYMLQFTQKFGLPKKHSCGGYRMGIFNGEEYVFKDSTWAMWDVLALFWRYGWDAYRLQTDNQEILKKFVKIYNIQAEGQAFRDVRSFLHALDPSFVEMTQVSLRKWFQSVGFRDLIIDELVTAVTKANYGQTADLHAFVGAIAVAGADPYLWAVEGGNKRVPEELLKHSRATLLRRKVQTISPSDNGGFVVTSVESDQLRNLGNRQNAYENNNDVEARSQEYDLVVIAAPMTKDATGIQLVNFTKEFSFPGRYERVLCTMVQGTLRPEGVKLAKGDLVDEILVTKAPLFFNALGKQRPVNMKCSEEYPDVWKIFSANHLTEDQLNTLFKERNSTYVIDWLAYPHYASKQELGDFELLPGLYHLNAMEWAGSAMEMSAISAKNAALLAFKHWTNNAAAGRMEVGKDEL